MKTATLEWLKAGELDLKTMEKLPDNEDTLHRLDQLYIDARYPGNLGLLPDGAPCIADAREFYDFSRGFNETIEKMLVL
jgi:HEPN domain-containing protein